jgi:malate synthase
MNCGADCWMVNTIMKKTKHKINQTYIFLIQADFEDALAPTWDNLLEGQANLIQTNLGTLNFQEKNKEYKFKAGKLPTLIVRPRGWHLPEKHLLIDGEPCSGTKNINTSHYKIS